MSWWGQIWHLPTCWCQKFKRQTNRIGCFSSHQSVVESKRLSGFWWTYLGLCCACLSAGVTTSFNSWIDVLKSAQISSKNVSQNDLFWFIMNIIILPPSVQSPRLPHLQYLKEYLVLAVIGQPHLCGTTPGWSQFFSKSCRGDTCSSLALISSTSSLH